MVTHYSQAVHNNGSWGWRRWRRWREHGASQGFPRERQGPIDSPSTRTTSSENCRNLRSSLALVPPSRFRANVEPMPRAAVSCFRKRVGVERARRKSVWLALGFRPSVRVLLLQTSWPLAVRTYVAAPAQVERGQAAPTEWSRPHSACCLLKHLPFALLAAGGRALRGAEPAARRRAAGRPGAEPAAGLPARGAFAGRALALTAWCHWCFTDDSYEPDCNLYTYEVRTRNQDELQEQFLNMKSGMVDCLRNMPDPGWGDRFANLATPRLRARRAEGSADGAIALDLVHGGP